MAAEYVALSHGCISLTRAPGVSACFSQSVTMGGELRVLPEANLLLQLQASEQVAASITLCTSTCRLPSPAMCNGAMQAAWMWHVCGLPL
jgi:hypothetical protein